MTAKLRYSLESLAFSLSGLLVAIALAWGLLALVNFSYPLWHDYGGIAQAIEEYGGQNRYRTGFEQTTPQQRYELFEGINHAIHRGGQGLAELSYRVPDQPEQQLLHEAEILHLQDVANLVTLGKYAAAVALLLWLSLGGYFLVTARPVPSLKHQVIFILTLVAVAGLLVLLWGPTAVFYAMHEWVFPPGHEWFFYYQDSLMSTMMFAPVLFGYIALEWLLLALLLFVVLQLGVEKLILRLGRRLGCYPAQMKP